MNKNLAIVLTVRMGSSRLPGKTMMDIDGKPLFYWIVRRLQTIGSVIVHPTTEPGDDVIANYATALGLPVHRGPVGKVIDGIDEAVKHYAPNAEYILRGLGDCPFMTKETVDRFVYTLDEFNGDFVIFATPPWIAPVYGSRESPYSREGWQRLVHESKQREHVDMYLHQNRDKFKIVYHEPPPNIYFRPYRLEVDYPDDLVMLRELSKHITLLANTETIIKTLDAHQEIVDINRACVEVTGLTRYARKQQRDWMNAMRGKPIIGWDNTVWNPHSENSEPIFCNGGTCLLGHGDEGTLYRTNGDMIKGDALIYCTCGTGRRWKSWRARSR